MNTPCSLSRSAAQCALEGRLAALRENLDSARRGEVEGVHAMRVASRRLRAALREFGPLFPRAARRELRNRVRAVTRQLGRARELDVMAGMLREELALLEPDAAAVAAAAHALERLAQLREGASAPCIEALQGIASEDFAGAARALLAGAEAEGGCLLKTMAKNLWKRFRAVYAAFLAWGESGDEETLHRVRIAFKELRYVCEIYAPHFDPVMRGFISTLKETQQHLGEWNDCRVLRDELRILAEDAPWQAAQGYPALIQRFDTRSAALCGAFAAQAAHFFSKPERRVARELFRAPAAPCCRAAEAPE